MSRSGHPDPYYSIAVRAGLVQTGEHCPGSPLQVGESWHTSGKGVLDANDPGYFSSCKYEFGMNDPL